MGELEKYIIELLQSKDKLFVQGFGTFHVTEKPAESHPVTHSFTPAMRVVHFSEEQDESVEDLVSVVAFYDNSTKEAAEKKVQSFVYDIRQKLKEHGSYTIKGLGVFTISESFDLKFKFDENADFNSYTFGLPVIDVKPAAKTSKEARADQKREEAEDNQSGFKIPIIVYILLPLILIAGIFMYFFNQSNIKAREEKEKAEVTISHKPEDNETITNSLDSNTQDSVLTDEIVKEKAKEATEKIYGSKDSSDNSTENKSEPKEDPNKYLVVAGSYILVENAEELKASLKKKGFKDIGILAPKKNEKYHKVVIGSFESTADAVTQIAKWHKEYEMIDNKKVKDWWVKSVPKNE